MSHPSELISAYLDGELHGRELESLLEHLSGCGRCSAEMGDMQHVRAAVRSLPVIELPSDLALEEGGVVVPLRRNRGFWVGASAAAVAVIIAVAALVTPPPQSVSVDELSSRFGARASLDPAFSPAKFVIPEIEVINE